MEHDQMDSPFFSSVGNQAEFCELMTAGRRTARPATMECVLPESIAVPLSPQVKRVVTRRSITDTAQLVRGIEHVDAVTHRWLVAHSITLLRFSLGAVFLTFGALKLFPDVSPAESLVEATTSAMTFGLVSGWWPCLAVGVVECVIGACLITGRGMRAAIYMLCALFVGMLSPLVLLAPRLFSGPHNAPTIEGQYVLKDVILIAATLVLATTLRGGTLTSTPDAPED